MEQRRLKQNPNWLLLIAILLIVLLIILLITCSHQRTITGTTGAGIDSSVLNQLQIPEVGSSDEIVKHTGYILSYNEEHEQANWVAYVLTADETNSAHVVRTNHFLPDPLVTTQSAREVDYEGSGYDRGHLAPAEDMAWSQTTMNESFYYSNMSPQLPAFNRGVWKRLEELVRYWSTVYDSIYIVTGPVLTPGLANIGPDKVSVPAYYYKVILQYNSKGVKGIGFILKNEASAATLKNFAVSIDSVEHLTGIDFFPKLPDDVENKTEADPAIGQWKWTRKSPARFTQ